MSLTSELRESDSFTRCFIDEQFPHLKTLASECNSRARALGLKAFPAIHDNKSSSMLVGTAIDYRVRMYFNRNIQDSPAILRGLTLLCNLKELKKPFINQLTNTNIEPIGDGSFYWEEHEIIENPWYWRRRKRLAEQLFSSYSRFVARVRPERRKLAAALEERLCRYCIAFAYLDWIGRAPSDSLFERMIRLGNPKPALMLNAIDSNLVRDVVGLSRQFYAQQRALLKSCKVATVGATFAGSKDIEGADCDLIIDGCLIDLKATIRPGLETTHLRQLVGYWLLDYGDAFRISSAAIALLRHGLTHRFSLQDLLGPNVERARLRREFRAGLLQDLSYKNVPSLHVATGPDQPAN